MVTLLHIHSNADKNQAVHTKMYTKMCECQNNKILQVSLRRYPIISNIILSIQKDIIIKLTRKL